MTIILEILLVWLLINLNFVLWRMYRMSLHARAERPTSRVTA